jgi:hypothetical protein
MTDTTKSGPSATQQTNTNTSGTQNTNQSQSGTQLVSTALPDWYSNAWQNLLGQGTNLYNNLQGQVAGLTPDQQNASLLANTALQRYMGGYNIPAYDVFGMGRDWDKGLPSATQASATAAQVSPDLFRAQQAAASKGEASNAIASQLSPDEISKFMSPYSNAVIAPALGALVQYQKDRQSDIAGKYAAQEMFGGSQAAVETGIADREGRQNLASTAGDLLNKGWAQAGQLAQANSAQRQAAALQNAQLQTQTSLQNALMGTDVSKLNASLGTNVNLAQGQLAGQLALANAQSQNQMAMANAAAQNQLAGQYYGNQFGGSQNDASRFLQAVQMQSGLNAQQLQNILQGTGVINQYGGQQQQTAQAGLNSYWQNLNNLASLLRAGGNPGGMTLGLSNQDIISRILSSQNQTGTTNQQTQKPIDFASLGLGGLGLLGKFFL